MKALIFETPNKPIIADVPMPTMKDTEVMIKTHTIGICHSDYELLAGRYIIPISYPIIPGHEWSGEIIEVGKLVKNFKVGDRVVGECVVKTPERLHHFGFSMNGADREFFSVNPEWLHKLPDSVDSMRASLIEPFTCGFYAMLRSGGTNASETVVVSGGGTIGLVTAAAALGMGARVIVADPIAKRREIAMKLGAETIDPTDHGVDKIKQKTGGKGADLVVECAGQNGLERKNFLKVLFDMQPKWAFSADFLKNTCAMPSMIEHNTTNSTPTMVGLIARCRCRYGCRDAYG